MRRLLLLVPVALIVIAAGAAMMAWYDYNRPGPLEADRTVVVPRGSGIAQIGRVLEEGGVVRWGNAFTLAMRVTRDGERVKAGEYAFTHQASLRDVIDTLISGETVVRRLTIPEGLTTAEVLRRVGEADGLAGDVEGAVPEGSLLPDTYHFSWGDKRADLVDRMRKAMEASLAKVWKERPTDFPLSSPQQLATLASIVEKETGLAAERPRVAAVFLNRLAKGMKLQSDPTVVYALMLTRGPSDRPLTRKDLESESPYNTYYAEGLPPGPIANPGLASLEAVIQPAETDALYFVADGSGGHAFSRTLDDHNRNVSKWRRVQRDRDAAAREKPSPDAERGASDSR